MEKTYYRVGLTTWAARLASIVFALFLSIFAMDVFSEGLGFGKSIIALLMHLIPSMLILLVLLISWNWEWVGGLVYILLGFLYIYVSRNRFEWSNIAIITLPLFALGILFWIGWYQRTHYKQATP
jgi:hypothetical protein